MRPIRTVGLAICAVAFAPRLEAQRLTNSFTWYLGGQGGVLGFETPSQTRAFVPSAGGHLLIVAKRTGLLISVDEAFGSSEVSGYTDVTTTAGVREVSFDRVRKYSAILTAYPIEASTQPYFGLGFGLLQVIDPQPGGVFTSQVQAGLAKRLASEKSTTGFISFVTGLQFRLNGVIAFGQYQITSAPASGQLMRGASHSVVGGLRFSLGGSKEGLRGGGY